MREDNEIVDFGIEIIECELKEECPDHSEFCFNEYADVCSRRFVLRLSKALSKERAKRFYDYIKDFLKNNGFKKEIEWCQNIPPLEKQDKLIFFQEYSWVVINSGMKNFVARKIFIRFRDDGNFDFNMIKHPQKNKAIKEVYKRLDFHFEHLKKSKNKLKYIKSLPHIGDITKYHLARNLGLDYAKPDRHLVRIAEAFGYNDVQSFCKDVSDLSGDKIGVVDLVFWRYATLTNNYLEIIKNWK